VIVTLDKYVFFSGKGDSGSVVFDLDGRVRGILDAGSGCNYLLLDLTYKLSGGFPNGKESER